MKLLLAAAIMLSFFAFAGYSMTTQCSQFTNEAGCENSECSWCDRCSGKEINNYAADRCVDSNLQCSYSCSRTCGANCSTDAECLANLTDTTCFYAGRCNACSCTYWNTSCPKNGTIMEQYGDRVCYYGARYCTSSGCSVNSCVLQAGKICDPVDGCVSCEGCSGNEFVTDKKCVGNDIIGKKIAYFCSAGICNSTRSEYLEKCKNGCNNGECNDELCNIDGINTNCNMFDGYYGDSYCKGNDVYKGYRNYGCGSNECTYTNIEIMLQSCKECQNGRCYDSGTIINITQPTNPPGSQPGNPPPQTIPALPNTIAGGRLYSGVLFGSNDIKINSYGRSGGIRFKVTRTNGLGTLTIEQKTNDVSQSQTIFMTRTIGEYNVSFSGNLSMYTTGSGWLFFVPAVFDVSSITVSYD